MPSLTIPLAVIKLPLLLPFSFHCRLLYFFLEEKIKRSQKYGIDIIVDSNPRLKTYLQSGKKICKKNTNRKMFLFFPGISLPATKGKLSASNIKRRKGILNFCFLFPARARTHYVPQRRRSRYIQQPFMSLSLCDKRHRRCCHSLCRNAWP